MFELFIPQKYASDLGTISRTEPVRIRYLYEGSGALMLDAPVIT